MGRRKGLMITQVSSVGDLVIALRDGDVEDKERFLLNGGWLIIKSWVEQTYSSNNWPVLHDIFNLILEFPPASLANVLLGKENPLLPVLATIIEEVVGENGNAEGATAQLCVKILKQWKKIIMDVKEEKGKLKRGTKVLVTDEETGMETTYQALGDDFRWWLVTSPGGTEEVERTREDYYQAVEEVIVEEKRKLRRSKRNVGKRCAPPKKPERKKRRRPPAPPTKQIVRYTPPSPSSSTEEVEEDEKLAEEDKVEVEEEKKKLEDKMEEVEEEKVKEDDEKSHPPLESPAPVKPTRRKYPMRRRQQRLQEAETDALEEKTMANAIRREKLLVKYRTPDLCREEKPGGIFGKRRRPEVIGSKEGLEDEASEEKQEEKVEDEKKLNKKEDKTGVIKKRRNVSGGGGSAFKMEPIVRLMEAIRRPLYPPRKIARILPSITAAKQEEARKKKEVEVDKQNYQMIVAAVARNLPPPPPPREEAREQDKQDGNQIAVAVTPIPPRGVPKEDEAKRLKNLSCGPSGASLVANYDPRLAARKKREEEAKKLLEEKDKEKNMVIAIYPLPPEEKDEVNIPPALQLPLLSPPPLWKLQKLILPRRRRRRRPRPVKSREKVIQEEREQFSFFPDFSTDSPAEPDPRDSLPLPYGTSPCIIPSKAVLGTRVHANAKSGWPKVHKDSGPVERITAYSSQLFSPQKRGSLPLALLPPPPPQVEESTKEQDKMQSLSGPIVPIPPPPAIQFVPLWYPVPVYPMIAASSPPPPPPLPATPPPQYPPPPPPPEEEPLPTVKSKYNIIRIPELPRKAYIPALPPPPPVEVEPVPPPPPPPPFREDTPPPPPRESTPPPPGDDYHQRPISPLGPQPIPIPLPVPAPTPQQLASISDDSPPFFPPSLLSLPLLSPPAPAHHQQQHHHQSCYTPRKIVRSPRHRKRRSPPLLPFPDQPQHFINPQFDANRNYFNPSPPLQFDNPYFNPPPPEQQGLDNPFINPPPPPSNFFCNLSGYQYPGPPPRFNRF